MLSSSIEFVNRVRDIYVSFICNESEFSRRVGMKISMVHTVKASLQQ